jgi:hypothetical protein
VPLRNYLHAGQMCSLSEADLDHKYLSKFHHWVSVVPPIASSCFSSKLVVGSSLGCNCSISCREISAQYAQDPFHPSDLRRGQVLQVSHHHQGPLTSRISMSIPLDLFFLSISILSRLMLLFQNLSHGNLCTTTAIVKHAPSEIPS